MKRFLFTLGFVLHLVLIGVFFYGALWTMNKGAGHEANGYIGGFFLILSSALICILPMWRDFWRDDRNSIIRR